MAAAVASCALLRSPPIASCCTSSLRNWPIYSLRRADQPPLEMFVLLKASVGLYKVNTKQQRELRLVCSSLAGNLHVV